MSELDVRPLTPERLTDLAKLFNQGGDPKWCWCSYYRVRSVDFRSATPSSNRAVLKRAADETAEVGRAPGLVAYAEGEVVGWVSVGPRDDYERLRHSRVLASVDDRPVWSIVCFVVARRSRGQGIATALLEAAMAYAAEHGATLLEAYPAATDGERIPAAHAYKGTVSMFERAGFEVVDRRRANRTSPARPIMRRSLAPPAYHEPAPGGASRPRQSRQHRAGARRRKRRST
jgi:ribosomal protein S18 acetylase RimI-like enzyme